MSAPLGFIGIGIMGKGMVKNLVTKIGCNLLIWNRNVEASREVANLYPDKIIIADTPRSVIERCQTTFCMLSNMEASISVVNSNAISMT